MALLAEGHVDLGRLYFSHCFPLPPLPPFVTLTKKWRLTAENDRIWATRILLKQSVLKLNLVGIITVMGLFPTCKLLEKKGPLPRQGKWNYSSNRSAACLDIVTCTVLVNPKDVWLGRSQYCIVKFFHTIMQQFLWTLLCALENEPPLHLSVICQYHLKHNYPFSLLSTVILRFCESPACIFWVKERSCTCRQKCLYPSVNEGWWGGGDKVLTEWKNETDKDICHQAFWCFTTDFIQNVLIILRFHCIAQIQDALFRMQ